ncbi:MAG: ATP-binding protein [Erysipelotrichaceae bacterium]|nr:ATP-binding protein [Erysipelotrichaceae bacterium]
MDEWKLPLRDALIKEVAEKHRFSDQFLKDHTQTLLRIYESRKQCEGCKGLYMCTQAKKGERLSLDYDGVLLREVEHCPYKKKNDSLKDFKESYVYSDISEDLLGLDLDNIELEETGVKGLFLQCYDIYEGKRDKGLYISGDLGVGKTYMCIALANSLVKKGKKVAFVKVSDFINDLRRSLSSEPGRYDRNMRKLQDADVLILDDIGSESVSSFSRDDVLFTILDYRMEHRLLTLFTSNLNRSDLLKHYTYDKNDKSSAMKAKRLLERIRILSDEYVLEGKNKRK